MLSTLTYTSVGRCDLVRRYFEQGYTQAEIIAFLQLRHGEPISFRTLQRMLHQMGLSKHKHKSDLTAVFDAVDWELQHAGQNIGYRSMHGRITKNARISTDRNTVRLVIKALDPEGVQLRQKHSIRRRVYDAHGPNYLWHVDGWDKLKPFGLCVHGCIDGFSRHIMWLEVAATNNDPYTICTYFAECAAKINGLPYTIRADCGTENVNMELMQRILRSDHPDDRARLDTAFLYGKSSQNQRIESWWSKFKKGGMEYWIDHFKALVDGGVLDTSEELHIECVRYCYTDILKDELRSTSERWNSHYIRKNRNHRSPPGKPDVMFNLPALYGTKSYLKPISYSHFDILVDFLTKEVPICKERYNEIFDIIVQDNGKIMPSIIEEADELFVFLVDTVENLQLINQ